MAKVIFDSEKEIEDFIILRLDNSSVCPVTDEQFELWFRQLNLGSYGIADIVKINTGPNGDMDITVMEIKKEVIDVKTLTQVARYIQGIKVLFSDLMPDFKGILSVYGEVVAPDISFNDDCVYLLNLLDDINAYVISCDMESGFSCEEDIGVWSKTEHKFPDSLAKIADDLTQLSNESIIIFEKFKVDNIVDITGN